MLTAPPHIPLPDAPSQSPLPHPQPKSRSQALSRFSQQSTSTHKVPKRFKVKSIIEELADQISKSIDQEELTEKRRNLLKKQKYANANKTEPNHQHHQHKSLDSPRTNCESKPTPHSLKKAIIQGNRKLKILKLHPQINELSLYFPKYITSLTPTARPNYTTTHAPQTPGAQLPSIRKLSLELVQSLYRKYKISQNKVKFGFPGLVNSSKE